MALSIPRHASELYGIAQHQERVVAGDVERDEFAAGRRYVRNQTTGARYDDRPKTAACKDAHQLDCSRIGGPDIERRYHDQDRRRSMGDIHRPPVGVGQWFGKLCGQARHEIRLM